MMMKLRVAILGAGRMGQAIERCSRDSDDFELAGIWSRRQQVIDLPKILADADVAVDFTLPEATRGVVNSVVRAGVPLVCGVSGLTDADRRLLVQAADRIPVLHDRNMSLGVAVMQRMVTMAAASFDTRFGAAIHETHHVHKIDAPSGTALQLGEALAAGRGQTFSDVFHYDPNGNAQAHRGQIEFTVERRGEVCGEHRVEFNNGSESLVLEHKVLDRRVFAEGALAAARWLASMPPGFYNMQNVVG